jgi:hypothetical protein
MQLCRWIESFPSLVSTSPREASIERLVEISAALCISYFDKTSPKFRPLLLPSLLQNFLPLTSHADTPLRLQIMSFLNGQFSLILAFCPMFQE